MKKIMFALVAVLAAVAAQAAYVDWQYQGKNAKSDTSWGTSKTEAANGLTAYLVTSAAWDGIKDTVSGAADIAAVATDSSTLIFEKTTKSVSYYTTHGNGATVAGARQVEAESGNYYVIIANDDGYAIAVNNVAVTAYDDISQGGSGKTPSITTTGQDNTALSFSSYGGGDVPEPTSGLLLLVGGAMLALRRKQK